MSNLYIIREDALNAMKENIEQNISAYKNGTFPALKPEQTSMIVGISIPDNLGQEMIDAITYKQNKLMLFESAKLLHKGLRISPLLASEESVWAYLTHGPLQNFTHQVWDFSQLTENQSERKYVLTHWFVENSSLILRNAVASLWWSVEISRIPDEEDQYRLTRLLFSNYTFRVVSMAQVLRMRNVLRGVLEWLDLHAKEDLDTLEQRGIFIAKYLNQLAGVKQLSVLSYQEIMSLLDDVKDVILSVSSRSDVQNKTAADIILEQREKANN